MALVKGCPLAVMGSDQMKSPELPLGKTWSHSSSRMKFSNWRSLRKTPVGFPVQTIIPSRTDQVLGAQLTLCQPLRSFPLKSGTKPPATGSSAGSRVERKTRTGERFLAALERLSFMWGLRTDGFERRNRISRMDRITIESRPVNPSGSRSGLQPAALEVRLTLHGCLCPEIYARERKEWNPFACGPIPSGRACARRSRAS